MSEEITNELAAEEALADGDTVVEATLADQGLLSREDKMAAVIKTHEEQEVEFDHSVEGHRVSDQEDGELVPLPTGLVQQDGAWFQKLTIDGEEVLQPYDQYQQQAQKFTAGDKRLGDGVKFQKELEVQEQELKDWQLRLEEQQVKLTSQGTPDAQTLPATDDTDIETEAQQIVGALFTGEEGDAVDAVKKLIVSMREGNAPSVDTDELTREAASLAMQQLDSREALRREDARKETERKAFEKFTTDYPTVVANPELFEQADRETDLIAAEYPNWNVEQVMLEAGKRVTAQAGDDIDTGSENSARQANKANLQPIPTIHSGAVHARAPEGPTEDTSPLGVIKQMRAGRGARTI